MPKRLNTGKFLAVVALALPAGSCWPGRKPPAAFTPPPMARPPVAGSAPTTTLQHPPMIAGDPNVSVPPAAPSGISEKDARAVAPRPAPKRATVTPPPAPKPPATTTTPTETQAAPPRLGQMFTPDQLRDYNRTIDESLDRVRKALAILEKKNLSPDQREIATRISTFQKQAEEAREDDLVTAVSLAKRADLLAQDLLERIP